MARIIAVANQKGGVGKTTTAISVGAGLSQLDSRVLLVDMDPQGTLSVALGMNVGAMEGTVYDVLRDIELAMEEVVVPTAIGCDLAPSDINLVGAEVELIAELGREYILKSKLAPLEEKYDYIFIDCPPSLGLLTLNALTAAREILIPVQSHYLALRGMELLLQTIAKVRARLNPEIEILGILPTFYDRRTRHAQEVVAELEHRYGNHLIKVNIPTTIKFADATTAGESILSFSSSSPAALAYGQLVTEVHNAKTS